MNRADPQTLRRCPWVNPANRLYVEYHDEEWGRPVKNDRKLFEFIILEGAQAGLSWETVLKKRKNYREAFRRFDPTLVCKMTKRDIASLMKNEGIIRNRLKIESTISNAEAFLAVQKEFGSFSKYLWGFVQNKTVVKRPRKMSDYHPRDELSDAISKDLKKRGFRFVGTTIVYAYLQAVGVIDEHAHDCFCAKS